MKINVKINDSGAQKKLQKLRRNTDNLQPTMNDIALRMKKEVMENFKTEGRPRKWLKLSPKYLEYKIKKRGAGKPILEFNGKLKQSINTKSSNDEARVFTAVRYGVYNQTGTRRGLPPRPFMPDDDNPDMPPFDNQTLNWIERRLKKAVMDDV